MQCAAKPCDTAHALTVPAILQWGADGSMTGAAIAARQSLNGTMWSAVTVALGCPDAISAFQACTEAVSAAAAALHCCH